MSNERTCVMCGAKETEESKGWGEVIVYECGRVEMPIHDPDDWEPIAPCSASRIATLEAALRPFKSAERMAENWQGVCILVSEDDLRRAAAALKGNE